MLNHRGLKIKDIPLANHVSKYLGGFVISYEIYKIQSLRSGLIRGVMKKNIGLRIIDAVMIQANRHGS